MSERNDTARKMVVARKDALTEWAMDKTPMHAERIAFQDGFTDGWNARAGEVEGKPIDVVLFCPKCKAQHFDDIEPDVCEKCGGQKDAHKAPVKLETGLWCDDFTPWLNPPHKSHRCHNCNTVWRPADVPTNGVEKVQTVGSNDTKVLLEPQPTPPQAEPQNSLVAALKERERLDPTAPGEIVIPAPYNPPQPDGDLVEKGRLYVKTDPDDSYATVRIFKIGDATPVLNVRNSERWRDQATLEEAKRFADDLVAGYNSLQQPTSPWHDIEDEGLPTENKTYYWQDHDGNNSLRYFRADVAAPRWEATYVAWCEPPKFEK